MSLWKIRVDSRRLYFSHWTCVDVADRNRDNTDYYLFMGEHLL
jgi:hypothetical protein